MFPPVAPLIPNKSSWVFVAGAANDCTIEPACVLFPGVKLSANNECEDETAVSATKACDEETEVCAAEAKAAVVAVLAVTAVVAESAFPFNDPVNEGAVIPTVEETAVPSSVIEESNK